MTNHLPRVPLAATVRRLGAVLVVLAVSGCGSEPAEPDLPGAQQDEEPGYVWEREPRPYRVFAIDGKRNCPIEHRYAQVEYRAPESEKALRAALAEVYGELKAEIEVACPDGDYKMVHLWCYDDRRESGVSLPMAKVETPGGAVEQLPDFDGMDVSITMRDPGSRPTDRQLDIYFAYMGTPGGIDDEAEAKRATAQRFGTTVEEVSRIWWHVWYWQDGRVVTDELIDEAMREEGP